MKKNHVFSLLRIFRFYQMFTTRKCLYSFSLEPLLVLIEYVPYGDLVGYLRKSRGLDDTYYKDPDIKPQTSLTSQQLIKFAWQVADGMSYLSSRSVSGSTLRNLKLHLLQSLPGDHWFGITLTKALNTSPLKRLKTKSS